MSPARWLKPRATRDEGRLRGLAEPAKAGFAASAPGPSVPRRATLQPPRARWLKPRATRDEGRLRGL
ncbi:MAG: hypothetical protein WCG26_10745, partial [Chloroflexales bacterium]